ncbi:MAG: CHAD domain-containing protein, partial [Candidatus Marinimicrobia bacterium]|nr:CHAD domain-containing protein [Candidatus Neomarinimicrobiota bacterium]
RDAQVSLDTYQAIVSVNNSDRDTVFEDFLRQNQFLKQGFPEKSDLDKIQTYIEDCRSLLNSTPSKLAPDQILMSIETSYQLGNQALKRAQGDPSSELVHAWRKKTKRLWYQLRWMFGDDLDNPNHPVLQSNVLGKSLGEIHDLDVLRILLDIDHPLQLRIQKLRQVLLTRAFEMGFELYIYQRTNFHHSLNQLY